MIFGTAVPVANEWRLLPAVLHQLRRHVDHIVLLRNRRAFSGKAMDLFQIPPDILSGPRIELIEDEWPSEHATRNAGAEHLRAERKCDYVFHVDSDEILLDRDLDHLKRLCADRAPDAIASRMLTYWKTPEWRIDPPEELAAVVVARSAVPFVHLRRVADGVASISKSALMRHLSYVRTDEEMREKLRSFAHAAEVLPRWFERTWKAWDADHDLENLHPVAPFAFRKAVFDPDPELNRILAAAGVRW